MAVFKCKMCGGTLEINNNESVAVCEYCGTKQTLPKLDDEKRVQLYDRANYFRRENEFDKAMGIYEMILSEEKTDSEAYWGIVLCRYGIEYVEDPRTHKRIPTVNRAQFTSIFEDEDYKQAIENSNTLQRVVYEEEADTIDKIQKGILEISSKEKPFDVFICYKETDASGNRTQDSVYAQDIYTALTKEGYKVFFSRITLENKLGSAYEPYIFAALNSAKVMLVIGTNKDNFNAVWVKNEWSRFISLIKAGKEKTIIPVYKDISPYEMPEEFQYLQSQDMGKIGYMQDIIHGISKLIPLDTKTESNGNMENQVADSMLKKALDFIAWGDTKSAILCLDTVHAYDPYNAMYYVCHLMIKYNCKQYEKIPEINVSIVDSEYYKYAIDYADEKLKTELKAFGTYTMYNELVSSTKTTVESFEKALKTLGDIDFGTLRAKDSELAEKIKSLKVTLEKQLADKREEDRLEAEKKEKEEQAHERKRKVIIKSSIIVAVVVVVVAVVSSIIYFKIIPANILSKGNEAYEAGDIETALSYYATVRGTGDAEDKIYEIEQSGLKYSQFGDTVVFGIYDIKGGNSRDRFAPIEWIVLERDVDSALLISKNCLFAEPYNGALEEVGWESCSLNAYLNGDFKALVFSEKEKKSLLSDVEMLNITQIKKYFATAESRQAYATDYAKENGIQVADNGYSCWWSRSDAISSASIPVLSTGDFGDSEYVSNDFVGVRPVIKVKIDISSEEANKFNKKDNEEIYKKALDLYKKNDLNGAMNQFMMIPEYKDSQDYIYSIQLTDAKAIYNSGDLKGYQSEIKPMKDAGYAPAIAEYDKVQKELNAVKAKEEADKKAAEDAVKALNGTWHWDNFYGYYMEINNGSISYGTNVDHSVNHTSGFWYGNVGTIEYDMETDSYIINDFDEAVKLTYDGSRIKMYNERGKSPIYFDGYAVRV